MAKPKKAKVLPESDVQCSSCAYFREEEGEGWGYCLRFPPQVFDSAEEESTKTMFPTVKPVWRCGEFRRKLDS